MLFKQRIPKDTSEISWTQHSIAKMRYYGISESKVRRVIRHPKRIEQGIAPSTIAAMQPAGTKRHQEIWMMYQLVARRANSKSESRNPKHKMKIISAWRYPDTSPKGKSIPIPDDIKDYILEGSFEL